MKKVKLTEADLTRIVKQVINEDKNFGDVTIRIEGNGFIKNEMIKRIVKELKYLQGERHLFVDSKEINPYM